MKSMTFAVLALAFLSSSPGFAADNAATLKKATAYARVQGLFQGINALAESNLSCETHKDCAFITISEQACGGASASVIVSRKNPHWDAIEFLAGMSIQAKNDLIKEFPIFAGCMLLDTPQLDCKANKCISVRPLGL